MVQRLLDGDRRKDRMGRIEKRPTRGRQPYAVNFVHAPAAQALMHRVVLAVDGEQRLALAASLGCDQLSRGDKTFLVGEPLNLARAHRFVSGLQPSHAHDGADYKVYFRMRGDTNRTRRTVSAFDLAQPFFITRAPRGAA